MKQIIKLVTSMSKIVCLIIRQPYASLIAFGKKRWEFRRYDAKRRGTIGIAASHREPWISSSSELNKILHLMPRGVVLATAELVTSFFVTSKDLERIRGKPIRVNLHGKEVITLDEPIGEPSEDVDKAIRNRRWESFAWLLENVKQLEKPIPIDRNPGSTWTKVTL